MSLFDRFRSSNSNSSNSNDANADQPILLCVNDVQVSVSSTEAAGKTVLQLFREFLDDQVNVNKLNNFLITGKVVSGYSIVEPGSIVRAAVTADEKG